MELSTREAAVIAGVETVTIRQNIRRKTLAATKRGRDWFIQWGDFETWASKRGIQLEPCVEIVSREGKESLLILRGPVAAKVLKESAKAKMSPENWVHHCFIKLYGLEDSG